MKRAVFGRQPVDQAGNLTQMIHLNIVIISKKKSVITSLFPGLRLWPLLVMTIMCGLGLVLNSFGSLTLPRKNAISFSSPF